MIYGLESGISQRHDVATCLLERGVGTDLGSHLILTSSSKRLRNSTPRIQSEIFSWPTLLVL